MNFDLSMIAPTVQSTSATLRDGAARLSPVLAIATLSGIGSDLVLTRAPDYFLLANLGYAVLQLASQAWVIAIALSVLGHDLGGRSTWRIGSLFVVSLFASVGIIAGLVALILPGLYLAGRWFVAAPAMLIEGKSASDALSRSSSLLQQYWLSASVLALVCFVLRFAPLLAAGVLIEQDEALFWPLTIGSNLVSEATGIAAIVATVVLYLALARPASEAQEIFG